MNRTPIATPLVGLLLVFGLSTGCTTPVEIEDTQENREQKALELARLAVELGALDEMLDQGVSLAWQASAETLVDELGRELEEGEQQQVRTILRDALAEFLTPQLWEDSVVSAYAAQFTAGELASILDFYSSPSGRKTLKLESGLTDDVNDAIEQALEGQMDAFVARVDQGLAAAFDGIEAGS